jgi:hypothetical protein
VRNSVQANHDEAMTMTTLELAMEVAEIKTRLVDVERIVRERLGALDATSPPSKLPLSNDELLKWLRGQGLVIDPPSQAVDHARRWRTLSDAERQAVLWELDHLPPGPMISDIVIEGRQ